MIKIKANKKMDSYFIHTLGSLSENNTMTAEQLQTQGETLNEMVSGIRGLDMSSYFDLNNFYNHGDERAVKVMAIFPPIWESIKTYKNLEITPLTNNLGDVGYMNFNIQNILPNVLKRVIAKLSDEIKCEGTSSDVVVTDQLIESTCEILKANYPISKFILDTANDEEPKLEGDVALNNYYEELYNEAVKDEAYNALEFLAEKNPTADYMAFAKGGSQLKSALGALFPNKIDEIFASSEYELTLTSSVVSDELESLMSAYSQSKEEGTDNPEITSKLVEFTRIQKEFEVANALKQSSSENAAIYNMIDLPQLLLQTLIDASDYIQIVSGGDETVLENKPFIELLLDLIKEELETKLTDIILVSEYTPSLILSTVSLINNPIISRNTILNSQNQAFMTAQNEVFKILSSQLTEGGEETAE